MTDFDADEPVPPLAPPKRRMARSDRYMVIGGLSLAAIAAFFPWYVFLNPDQFSSPVLVQDGDGTQSMIKDALASASQLPDLPASDEDSGVPGDLDALVTATTRPPEENAQTGEPVSLGREQPLPAHTGFRLMHVANGRALIEDQSGMYIVRVGSILPDNSRLATLEQRDGKWVLVTSSGAVYERN